MRGARCRYGGGFTLLELLVSLAVGLLLGGAMVQALLAEGRLQQRMGRRMREVAAQRRTLELIRSDAMAAETVRLGAAQAPACGLGGRRVVLELTTREGAITYTVGSPPSGIWRGQVLMRCGPAFGLLGDPSGGQAQNRVLLDALAGGGLGAVEIENGVVELRLQQEVPAGGETLRVESALTVGLGG